MYRWRRHIYWVFLSLVIVGLTRQPSVAENATPTLQSRLRIGVPA
jgi:hypothetical protein